EQLIDAELTGYVARVRASELSPVIEAFTGALGALAAEELASFKGKHGGLLSRDPEAALERFAHGLLGRLKHLPLARLKALEEGSMKQQMVTVLGARLSVGILAACSVDAPLGSKAAGPETSVSNKLPIQGRVSAGGQTAATTVAGAFSAEDARRGEGTLKMTV